MRENEAFRTQSGYEKGNDAPLTAAMEDYLEMICRMKRAGEDIRVRDLARHLQVRPSSVSRMLRILDNGGYLTAEKYEWIHLTERGEAMGEYLLFRHEAVHRFLCRLNGVEDALAETELIEHFLSERTVRNLDRLLR